MRSHNFVVSRIFGASSSRKSTREAQIQNEGVLRRRVGKCLNDISRDAVRRVISTVKTNLRIAADTSLLEMQYLDHEHAMFMTFMPACQLLVSHNTILKGDFCSCLIFFFCPKASQSVFVKRVVLRKKRWRRIEERKYVG